MRMSIDVSQIQFRQPDFIGRLKTILAETGAEATDIELEITESVAMKPLRQSAGSASTWPGPSSL